MDCFALDVAAARLASDVAVRSLRTTLEEISRVSPAFAYAKISVGDVTLAARLGEAGFRLIDTSVRFLLDGSVVSSRAAEGGELRRASAEDRARIVAIASTCFRFSRFHLDPLFPPPLADRIKGAWMESYFDGKRGSEVLVAEAEARAGPAGFLAVLLRTGQDGTEAVIDLIGVDREHERRGLGATLVAGFIAGWRARAARLSVGTQLANAPSIRLYEQCGFRFSDSAYVLHAHYRDGRMV